MNPEKLDKLIEDYEMNPEKLDKLIDDYAWKRVNDMDVEELRSIVAQQIAADFDTESDEYIIDEIKESCPELLGSN